MCVRAMTATRCQTNKYDNDERDANAVRSSHEHLKVIELGLLLLESDELAGVRELLGQRSAREAFDASLRLGKVIEGKALVAHALLVVVEVGIEPGPLLEKLPGRQVVDDLVRGLGGEFL